MSLNDGMKISIEWKDKKSAAVSHKRKLNQESDFLCELEQKYIQYHSQTRYCKGNQLPENMILT